MILTSCVKRRVTNSSEHLWTLKQLLQQQRPSNKLEWESSCIAFCFACFITLSFIKKQQGYKHRDAFIITKAATENTVADFWKMVLEKQCHTIVMLNKSVEQTQVNIESKET